MGNQETRNKLINATKKLLTDGTPVEKLTARLISSTANTNLAMINYCFKSKDELIKIAVDEIVSEEFNNHSHIDTSALPAKEQLCELLLYISYTMIKYIDLTKASIPYLMLNDDITLPLDLLPYVKKHFGNKKSDTECRLVAFNIVYTMQLIFYRNEDFRKYSGIDITDTDHLKSFISMQLNLLLGDEGIEK